MDQVSIIKIIRDSYLTMVLALVAWATSPVIAALIFFIILICDDIDKKNEFILLLFISCTLGIVNATKIPVTDLLNYNKLFTAFGQVSLVDYWKIQALDPFFYFPTAVLAHLFDSYHPIFIFIWTVFTYLLVAYSSIQISNLLSLKRYVAVSLLIFSMLIGCNFTLSGHLVRQYAAMSILLMAISLYLRGNKNYFYVFLIAALTHFSAALFFPAFLIKKFENKSKIIFTVALFLSAAFFLGSNNFLQIIIPNALDTIIFSNELVERGSLYSDSQSSEINLSLGFAYCIVYAFVFFFYLNNENIDEVGQKIFAVLSTLFFIVIIFRNSGLLFDRYMFYGPLIFVVGTPYIVSRIRNYGFYISFVLIILSFFYFFRILMYSEYVFISNDLSILMLSLYDYLVFINH